MRQAPDPTRVRVVTLNIWNRQGPWNDRQVLIRRELAALQPDVVGLQEVLAMKSMGLSQLDELAADLFPHAIYSPTLTLDDGHGFTFGNGLLSRFAALEVQHDLLPNPMAHEARGLLSVLLDTPHGQLPVHVTHLDWQLDLSHARCQQISFVVDRIRAFSAMAQGRSGADVLPAVLLGDFNAEANSDELRFLRGLHALPSSIDGEPRAAFFNDPTEYLGTAALPTFSRHNAYAAICREPNRRLDYVFVAPPDRKGRGEPLSTRLCFEQPEGSVWPSDHFGVLADLQLAPQPG